MYFAENGNFIVERIYPNSRKNRCPEWAFSSLWSTLRILRFSKTWKPFLHWITPNTKYCSVFKRQMTVKWKCMWTVWCKSIRQCSPKSSTAAKMSVSIPRSTTCIRGTRRPITNMYWSQTVVSEVSSNTHCSKISYFCPKISILTKILLFGIFWIFTSKLEDILEYFILKSMKNLNFWTKN